MLIHHLALRTADPSALAAFYQDVLGLEERQRSERSIWLKSGEAVLMLERAEPGEPTIDRATMELIAFAVTQAQRQTIEARVQAQGGHIEARTEHTSYFRDPDGRRLAISTYPVNLGDAPKA